MRNILWCAALACTLPVGVNAQSSTLRGTFSGPTVGEVAGNADIFMLPASRVTCALQANGTYTCKSTAKAQTLTNVTATVIEAHRIHTVLQANGMEIVVHAHEKRTGGKSSSHTTVHRTRTRR